jgi:spore maturation protein CgeB
MYKIVKVTSFYRDFLKDYYSKHPEIINESYAIQYQHLMSKCFGWSDFYARHLNNLGNDAYEIVYNAEPLQKAWAKENVAGASGMGIVFEQIKRHNPDIVFFQDSITFNGDWVKQLKEAVPDIKLTIGFTCSMYNKLHLEQFKVFDFILVCGPNFQQQLSTAGLKTYLFRHAFETSILDSIEMDNSNDETDFIFLGSFIPGFEGHTDRQIILNDLIKAGVDVDIYANVTIVPPVQLLLRKGGYVISQIMKSLHMESAARKLPGIRKTFYMNEIPSNVKNIELIKKLAKPPLYGLDMFKALSKSKIGFNNHAYVAGNFAVNIRLFEITGVGSCMITDWKKNINELFEVDKEILTYKSAEECTEKVKWLLDHPSERESIAKAGQQRTLRDHTIKNRADQLNEIILSELKRKV